MTLREFVKSLSREDPPSSISEELRAMWFDGKGNWKIAHQIAQNIEGEHGSWIHAYLHRKEGDLSNAQFWYQKAGKSLPATSINIEWIQMSEHFLEVCSLRSAENT